MVMHRILLVVYIAIVSLLVGSFLNVVIYRVPRRESIVFPSSRCPKCGHVLHTWELIPVLSWLFLRGHCHACHARISWRYPAMELLTLAASMFVLWKVGLHWVLIPSLMFTWILLALSAIDLETCLLPDRITKPGMVLGLLVNATWFFDAHSGIALTTPLNAVLGLVFGYGGLWLFAFAYRRMTGVHGMGGGDLKMLGMIGAWLGWKSMLFSLWVGGLAGGVVAIAYLLAGKGRQYAIPFGPYLAVGAFAAMLYASAAWGYLAS